MPTMVVGEETFIICNNVHFNSFLNEVSKKPEYPHLLERSFVEGRFSVKDKSMDVGFTKSSVVGLLADCRRLKESIKLEEWSEYIADQLIAACEESLRTGKDIELY